MNRRLYRCRDNRRLAGVAAGVAEFFGLDPTLVRVVWFLSIFFGGFSILLYVAMAIIVPLEPLSESAAAAEATDLAEGHRHMAHANGIGGGRLVTAFGVLLLAIGGITLLDVVLPGIHSVRYVWPLLFLGAGAALVLGAVRRERSPE